MNKKDIILRSVLKLVNREGFYHLNMKKIAAESGVAAGTIYVYFKGKEELINDLYVLAVNEMNQAVVAGFSPERSVLDNFTKMTKCAVDFYLSKPDYFSFIEQYTYAPFLFKENRDQNFSLLRPIFKLLAQGKEEQLFKPLPDEILISLIYGSINTMIKLHLAKKIDFNSLEVQHQFYDAVWSAVKAN